MSSRARRLLLLTSAAIVAFYACVVLLWAVHPLQDSVPVGIDYTQAKYTAGVLVSAKVDCHTLFSSSGGASKPLPTLTPQVAPHAQLAFQRAACSAVHRDARVIFGLDTLVTVLILVAIALVFRRERHLPPLPVVTMAAAP